MPLRKMFPKVERKLRTGMSHTEQKPFRKGLRDEVSDYYSFDAEKAKKLLKEELKKKAEIMFPLK